MDGIKLRFNFLFHSSRAFQTTYVISGWLKHTLKSSSQRRIQQTNTHQQSGERTKRETKVKKCGSEKVEQLKPQTGSFPPTIRMPKHRGWLSGHPMNGLFVCQTPKDARSYKKWGTGTVKEEENTPKKQTSQITLQAKVYTTNTSCLINIAWDVHVWHFFSQSICFKKKIVELVGQLKLGRIIIG